MTEENKGAAVALPGDDADRGAFERWVSAPPFEYSIEQMPEKSAWPGSYHFISVQLAWCAWREAQLELRANLATAEQDRDCAWQNVRIAEKARQEEMAKRDAAEAEVVWLRAQRDEAVAALGALRSVCFDRRDALNEFERFGDLYYREFGRLRPGKDDPISYSNSEENREQYNTWTQARTEAAIDLADAALASLKGQA